MHKREGQKFIIKGDPSLSVSAATLKSALKSLTVDDETFWVECNIVNLEEVGEAKTIPAEISEVLMQFEDAFQDPQGLPPSRLQDHAIVLKEGANIPNLRPYRYPHYQKNEIEKLIKDMLKAGIIRPSVSPYTSPIIQVKKKDGS